jgi:hypothetical protein
MQSNAIEAIKAPVLAENGHLAPAAEQPSHSRRLLELDVDASSPSCAAFGPQPETAPSLIAKTSTTSTFRFWCQARYEVSPAVRGF